MLGGVQKRFYKITRVARKINITEMKKIKTNKDNRDKNGKESMVMPKKVEKKILEQTLLSTLY